MDAIVETVKIVHTKDTEGKYRYFADFFRFTGFLVYNCLDTSDVEDEQVPITFKIVIGDGQVALDGTNPIGEIKEPNESTNAEKIKILEEVITYLQNKNIITEEDKPALEKCAHVYVQHELMKMINTTNTFHKFKDLMQKAYQSFGNAYDDLLEAMSGENAIKGKYAIYARSNCAKYVNEICKVLNMEPRFDTGKVMAYLKETIEPEGKHLFVNAYLLLGFLADVDKIYISDAVDYYKKILDYIGKYPYSSYIHYRLGHDYEKVYGDMKKAMHCYNQAYEVNQSNYRALYKIGLDMRRNEEYEKACSKYKEILQLLCDRYQNNMLHAIGYEYLYKALDRLGSWYNNDLDEPEIAVGYYRELEKVFEKLDNKVRNSFYVSIYGDDTEKYLEYTRKRLSKHNLNVNLYKLFVKLGDTQSANHYWNEIMQENEIAV